MSKKIVIDPGHGGSDPGTSRNEITEKDYSLKISKYIKKRLDDLGIENAITRDTDETLDPKNRPKRVQSFFGSGDDVIVVSNHLNAGGGDGAEIIYSLRNNDKLSKTIARELESAGQNIRKTYQRRLPSNPSLDYYYIMRNTPNNETIIVEYGFVDSKEDDVKQIKESYEQLAEAVVKALADYIGVPYIAPIIPNTYTVKSGDTLWSIAKKYNLSIDELKKINNLNSNTLIINQVLELPTKEISDIEKYTVKPGDTLYNIANKFGISVNELKSINNLSTSLLSIGQVLNVKPSNMDIPKENVEETTEYIVKNGDTLYAISNKFKIPVDKLKDINNLNSNFLSVGQIIKLKDDNNNVYVVKSGDTLYSIARNNNTTVSELIDLNNLSTTNLFIGQKLLLPN
ncbi:MAG: LysM peptidoglycan-binding domain-containing protein [Firmicutes bacterium]|nr:LysM peptidoglycan-binding domain-containing protein [Bacillota bacterium]